MIFLLFLPFTFLIGVIILSGGERLKPPIVRHKEKLWMQMTRRVTGFTIY